MKIIDGIGRVEMNNLNLINKNFDSGNLSKYQFTISLIKECVRCEILPENFLYIEVTA